MTLAKVGELMLQLRWIYWEVRYNYAKSLMGTYTS